jgi:cell division control protein 7
MAAARTRHAKAPFEIHNDPEIDDSIEEEEEEQPLFEDDENMQDQDGDDGYSETSDESDGVVERSVQEDMDRFQETFKGIKDRFRLINRIGEG